MVLNLGEFGGTLLVHAVLKVAAHRPVTLTHLAEHISLVRLAVDGLLEGALLVRLVLSLDLRVNLLLLVVLQPVSLSLERLLQEDVLLTVLVHVFEKIDASLVLTAPLLLTSVPLLFILLGSQLLDVSFVSGLV